MEAEKLNKKSLDEQGSFSNNNVHPSIEPIASHINSLLEDGNSIQEVVYNLVQETYELSEVSAALEHLGYKPDAIADLFQEIEMATNQQQETQGAPAEPMSQAAAELLNEMQGPQQPEMQLGGMAPAAFNFGFAIKDFINEIKGTSDQHLDGTLGSKRHRWEVNFKGANVNPKDYYVTSQGELRNSKEDKKKKMKKQAEMDDDDPAAYKEFIPYQGKKVGSTYFNDWLSANKPKIKDLPFEQSLKSEDNPFGINYNPFAINQKIKSVQPQGPTEMGEDGPIKKPSMLSTKTGGFEEWYNARNAPKGPTEMGDFGPVKKQNMLRTGMKYGGYFQEGGESYTVKSGDVLSQIAIDNNIPVKDILNANPGLEPDKIQIGQSLVLPKQINDLQNTAKKASKRISSVSDKFKEQRKNSKNKIYNDLKSEYIKDLMIQENASKDGWDEEKQLWFPIKAPEGEKGNLDDIGFGYKMSPEEKKLFKNGITNEKLMSLVNRVLKEKEQAAKKYFNNKNYGVDWDELDAPAQILLTDYAYNGALSKFKKFPKAIAEKDKAAMLKEYERSSDGKLLTERNKWTKKFIEDNFKYGGLHKAQDGDETEIKKTDYMRELGSDLYDEASIRAKRYLNPFNWFVDDYSDSKTFDDAYTKARSSGNDEFYYNNKKFTTEYDGSEDEQLRTTGVIDGKNNNERSDFSNRIENNVYNGGFYEDYDFMQMVRDYFSPIKEVTEPWGPDSAAERDMLSLYLEKPLRYNTLGVSKYAPSIAKGDAENKRYYKINDYWNNVLDVIPKDKWEDYKEGYLRSSSAPYSMPMNDYTVGQGYDEDRKQTYLSYYDKWDINPFGQGKDAPDLSMGLAKPFDLYDRQYYVDYGDGNMRKRYYDDDQIAEFDPEKKNFNTLALQKELVNRGYKLPGSKIAKEKSKRPELEGWKLEELGLTDTNRDNDYDGILGPETIAALKDLQKRSKNVTDYYMNLERKKYGGDLKKYQFAGSVPMLPRVNPIPNQSFSNIEPIDFIGGGTQFNTANANTFTNPMNTSNPMGPTGIPGGASGHYYRGNIGPGSGMGAMNFENMDMENLRNQYMNSQKPVQNANSEFPSSIDLEGGQFIEDLESGMYDWQAGEDAGAWDQDPTVKRKRTVGTAMSNAENWLKNSKPARIFGSAANLIKSGAGVVNSLYDNTKLARREEEQRLSGMADNAPIYYDKEINARQSLQDGKFGEKYKLAYEVAKYGTETYRNGGNISNWFEQNNIPRAQEGMEVEIDNDTLAALIAAGADIEML